MYKFYAVKTKAQRASKGKIRYKNEYQKGIVLASNPKKVREALDPYINSIEASIEGASITIEEIKLIQQDFVINTYKNQ